MDIFGFSHAKEPLPRPWHKTSDTMWPFAKISKNFEILAKSQIFSKSPKIRWTQPFFSGSDQDLFEWAGPATIYLFLADQKIQGVRDSQPLQNIMEEKLRIVCDDSAAATGGSRASNAGRLRRSPCVVGRVQLVSSCVTARAQVWQRKLLAANPTRSTFHIVPWLDFSLRAINSRAYPSVVHCRTGKVVGCRTSFLDVGALTSDRMLLSKLRMTCCCDARCSARELVVAQPPVQCLLCSMSMFINALAHRELPG